MKSQEEQILHALKTHKDGLHLTYFISVMKHNYLNCQGVMCEADPTPDWKKNVIWYAGESICGRSPYSRIQKIQSRINRLFRNGKIKFPRMFYTGELLEKLKRITSGVKGLGRPEGKILKRWSDTTPKLNYEKI